MPANMTGRRILVVEDEPLIAIEIENVLLSLGCTVVGPTGSLRTALELATVEVLDGAILDVNIRGLEVYPVADVLLGRGVEFVIASGYDDWALPLRFRNHSRLIKPFDYAALVQMLRTLQKS